MQTLKPSLIRFASPLVVEDRMAREEKESEKKMNEMVSTKWEILLKSGIESQESYDTCFSRLLTTCLDFSLALIALTDEDS